MKLAHAIFCAAALAFAAPAFADEPAAHADTLFSGVVDLPIADGSSIPDDCQYPETLSSAQGVELACIVATDEPSDHDVGIAYIAWLGEQGWRRGDNIIGGFTAVRDTENGCTQVLDIFPHGEGDEAFGLWFALESQPRCGAHANP